VSSTTADRLDEVASSPKAILIDENDDERSWRNLPCSKGRAAEQPTPDEPAALFYTSGTTGPPKGVPLTHANLMFQLNALIDAQIVGPEDRLLLPLPLHHVYPFVIGMLAPLSLGLAIIMPRAPHREQSPRAVRDQPGQLALRYVSGPRRGPRADASRSPGAVPRSPVREAAPASRRA
jgi:long-chain acyl-CoA synthetase